MSETIGFIGLGSMGKHMSQKLINEGFNMVLYDINNELMNSFSGDNVQKASSPKEVGDKSDIVLVSLPTPDIVKDVAIGSGQLIEGNRIKVFIDLSTTGPIVSREIGDELEGRGINVLDSPVSGGVIGAKNATLSLMVAGKVKVLEDTKYILKNISKNVFYVGEDIGQGQVMKVINNLLSSAALALTSEAAVLGSKAGLNSETMINVLNQSSGRNSATEDKFKKSILNRKFDYGFSSSLAYKDMKLCMDLAEDLQVPMYLGQNITHFWRHVVKEFGKNGDYTEVIKMFENWSDIKVDSMVEEGKLENV